MGYLRDCVWGTQESVQLVGRLVILPTRLRWHFIPDAWLSLLLLYSYVLTERVDLRAL